MSSERHFLTDLSHLPIKLAVHCAALVQVKLKSDTKKLQINIARAFLSSRSRAETHSLANSLIIFSPDTFLFGVVGVELMSGVDRVELISGVAELVEIIVLTGVVLMSGVELISEAELIMAGCETVQLELAAIVIKFVLDLKFLRIHH